MSTEELAQLEARVISDTWVDTDNTLTAGDLLALLRSQAAEIERQIQERTRVERERDRLRDELEDDGTSSYNPGAWSV